MLLGPGRYRILSRVREPPFRSGRPTGKGPRPRPRPGHTPTPSRGRSPETNGTFTHQDSSRGSRSEVVGLVPASIGAGGPRHW